MERVPKAKFTEEFKVAAVQLVEAGRRPAEVARELGVVEQTLHNGLKAYRDGRLGHGTAKAVTPEQMEIARLRSENARLRMEAEILKKAAAYFARESL
jgi:transposase